MLDGQGKWGDFSPAATFTVEHRRPDTISPTQGQPMGNTPVFRWNPVSGAAHYRLQISINKDTFNPLIDERTLDGTFFTPMFNYPNPANYYWRVAMLDQWNNLGPYTDAVLFTVGMPPRAYLPLLVR
jgi:hypothetical protein